MRCKVIRQTRPPKLDAGWMGSPWKEIPPELILNHMGKKPEPFPRAEVKMAYDDLALYLMFRVGDRYVRAVAKNYQDRVWEDSCVEFFFTPGTDLSRGYFNLEMNCGGTLLFHFQPGAGQERVVIPESDCRRITLVPSLHKMVDPEIVDPITWTIACRIPLALLEKYCPVTLPAPQVEWRANFYKCADKTSHPHWLTWSLVEFPKPNFHLPQFFGRLVFQ